MLPASANSHGHGHGHGEWATKPTTTPYRFCAPTLSGRVYGDGRRAYTISPPI
ncbi:predicted protein [Pyrenophora tritici-repentis Pt-1C-BFP]|uniref:Uncharacterized protein n=1 Tax=Pyrenophora tritici-repentis (strain Pt-1C-BFP) TaxID=426418 RepID=B2W4F3_PYRTR|nr:uncharacterized protein PTRG_04503 [Pyrenophora tritici-repentis Pt-1C-BFP]EDU47410.1 predicted protein [Pyrenophora tritici-repentis Pt-1C-BFP]